MNFLTGFVKTAEGLGDMINSNIKKVVGTPKPPTPPPAGGAMSTAFGSIRKAFGG
jgi:hypothetical protein